MIPFLTNLLTASVHGSIVILAVLVLRLILRRAPRKYICFLWLLAGLRLLMPIEIRSDLSLQPQSVPAEELVTAGMNLTGLLPIFWGAVACCFGLYSLVSYLRLKGKVRDAVRIRGGWESDRIDTAFILGFIKPRIYIPMGMTRENRKYILEHERTHLDKGDHWIKMIGFLALALHWFNPLVWLAYVCLCRDIEVACDERVIQFMELEERKGYSAALLSCTAKQPHYMASPVAFGEVSVKQRILSVLKYKKPAFWISLLCVLAIGFVAVCLLTSPTLPPAAAEPAVDPTVETEPGGFAERLHEGEIAYTCEKAIEQLMSQDSYCIHNEQVVTYASENQTQTYTSYSRKSGENFLSSPEDAALGGSLTYGGQVADHMGDLWCWQGEAAKYIGPQAWLEEYSPKGKVVTFPEGTGILDPDTVAFHIQWTREKPFARDYDGIVEFTFLEDGTIRRIHREYSYVSEDGEETRYENTLTFPQEAPEVTAEILESIAREAVTPEELEEYRINLEVIDKVPSNKTSYDKDYALGAGSKQWKFFGEELHVRIGAENPTSTGLTLVYSEADDDHLSLTAESGYWLERLVDGKWQLLTQELELAERGAEQIRVGWTTTAQYSVDWTAQYGELDNGYYRIGRYHTMTKKSGETETAVCYAKFRLYDPRQEELLSKCASAVDALLQSDSYHLYLYDWMPENVDYDYYLNEEIWKAGDDFLLDTRYPYRSDLWTLKGRSGVMRRDGTCYDLKWAGDSVTSPVTEWNTNTYLDESNLELWTMDFRWYDSQVEKVVEQGDKITILQTYSYSDAYAAIEIVLTLDDTGNLKRMIKSLLPSRNSTDEDRVLCCEMVVFDEDPASIAAQIHAQNVQRPAVFSYEQDRKEYPDGEKSVRTKNFVNTAPRAMDTVLDVIDTALRDCTLPATMDMEPGTNMSRVFYDEQAGIWKVEFTASWDSRIYQAVYLNEQGITQRTLTLEREIEY